VSTTVLVYCIDFASPLGGAKKLYRHVDVLNEAGFSAYIVHEKSGFRCQWFKNQTPVLYMDNLPPGIRPDYLVLGESLGPKLADLCRGVKKVIFNQNAYFTFMFYPLDQSRFPSPYFDPEIAGCLTVSDDNRTYLEYAFPGLTVHRIHNAVDPSVFSCSPKKRRRIAFMTRKNASHLTQVINLLKFRGALRDYELTPIDNVTEEEVAAIMRDASIFLSFGYPEGFSLPPAEAMACGCVVIGYDGLGGREFFRPEFSYPVPFGDILTYARTVEEVIRIHETNPSLLAEKGLAASSYIRANYSPERERDDILQFWNRMRG
jgi:glycosyltransferase involved in cell wall biosynthesis